LVRNTFLETVLGCFKNSVFCEDAAVVEVSVEACGGWRARRGDGELGRLVSPQETQAASVGFCTGVAYTKSSALPVAKKARTGDACSKPEG
jgi:hypothetical protein